MRRWIWSQGWESLRDIQEAAIPLLLAGVRDVVVSAGTASGKTEAVFLPICSRLVEGADGSVRALYVGPTKALINDQFERLDALCEHLGIPVHRWHGDVAAGRRKALLKNPSGILLITPESLEAMFVTGAPLGGLFAQLGWIVVDELHAFIGTERGRQLQSLMHRLELALRRRVPRVGLSATLGEPALAAEFLRPREGCDVEVVSSPNSRGELKLQVRGYRSEAEPDEAQERVRDSIASHLFQVLRGANHLVFANSRAAVEDYADRLRRRCESEGVPNEFLPHHGNLAKDLREDTEAALKAQARPTTVIATTTLEMGIDVGIMKSVAQVGVPPSVSSLRQRVGRSGRRDAPAILRLYVEEQALTGDSFWPERLRLGLLEAVAMVELLLEGWCEPPAAEALHPSTLVQQVLSIIAQHGGATAAALFTALCQSGPFTNVRPDEFARLLRRLGQDELLQQSADGTLLLGERGERLVNHYSFYAAFPSPEEFRLEAGGRTLGTLPIDQPLMVGGHLIFGGRRWRIEEVRHEEKLLLLTPAPGGRVPRFEPAGRRNVHDRVRERMWELLGQADVPAYLDATAAALLGEARDAFRRAGLDGRWLVTTGQDVLLFVWKGDRVVDTLRLQLCAGGLDVDVFGPILAVASTEQEVRTYLESLAREGEADGPSLMAQVENQFLEKYDYYVEPSLLARDYAARHLDPAGALRTLRKLLG